jgi:anti-anti-sigma factor
MGGKKARCPLCGQTMAIPNMAVPTAPSLPKKTPAPPAPPEEQAAPPEKKIVEKIEEKVEEKKEPPLPPEEPTTDAPTTEDPPAEEPITEEPTAEEPTTKEPTTEEPPTPQKQEEETPAEQPALPTISKPQAPGPGLAPTRPGAESVMVGAPASASHPTPTTLARVAKEAAETGYELLGGQLRVVGAIGYDLNTGFRDKCDQLLASGEKELLVDLSQVLYLSSSHIGVIARLATDAMGQDRKVTVRVTGKVARVLKFAGIDRLVELESVDA